MEGVRLMDNNEVVLKKSRRVEQNIILGYKDDKEKLN